MIAGLFIFRMFSNKYRSQIVYIYMMLLTGLTLGLTSQPAFAQWTMTFSDEFNGSALDTNKWSYTDYWGQQNDPNAGDMQCYDPGNVSVSGGSVTLIATTNVPFFCNPNPGNLFYTSGEITTATSFSQAYGYFEMKAQFPAGVGLWPAFRLAIPGGSFPPLPPDVDIVNLYGQNVSNALFQYDYLNNTNNVVSVAGNYNAPANLTAGFHTYGLNWQPGSLTWYVDGVQVFQHTGSDVYSNPMYIIARLAVGGAAGSPDATTPFPANFAIDSIHAYSCSNPNNISPNPCLTPPSGADTTAPTVAITNPKDGSVIDEDLCKVKKIGRVPYRVCPLSITADASDNVGVTRVDFYVNGNLACSDVAAPYTCKTTFSKPVKKSRHNKTPIVITAKASDAAGNVGNSQQVSVRFGEVEGSDD